METYLNLPKYFQVACYTDGNGVEVPATGRGGSTMPVSHEVPCLPCT